MGVVPGPSRVSGWRSCGVLSYFREVLRETSCVEYRYKEGYRPIRKVDQSLFGIPFGPEALLTSRLWMASSTSTMLVNLG